MIVATISSAAFTETAVMIFSTATEQVKSVVAVTQQQMAQTAEYVGTVANSAQEFIVATTATFAATAKATVAMKVAAIVSPLHVALPVAAIASIALSFADPGPITGALFPVTMGIWWIAYKFTSPIRR